MKNVLMVLTALFVSSSAMAYDQKPTADYNFRFSPIGLLVGSIGVDLSKAITPEWTVGPELNYWKFSLSSTDAAYTSDYDISSSKIGVRANWYKNGVYTDGLYVGPSISYASAKVTTTDALGEVTGEASGLFLGCLVGYGWFWDSFNMTLAGGAQTGLGDTKVKVTDSSGETTDVSSLSAGVALEYNLGWTF
ncbi:hypothetical protein [Bdellovibrio sp. HCB337]|uniref:hypothetical protein n=1 Tax=Bdellovibrio sp. HCB337 TaxID=3394358 RepID=UPI0039A70EE9